MITIAVKLETKVVEGRDDLSVDRGTTGEPINAAEVYVASRMNQLIDRFIAQMHDDVVFKSLVKWDAGLDMDGNPRTPNETSN